MRTITVGVDDNGVPIKAIVDDADFDWLIAYPWNVEYKNGNIARVRRSCRIGDGVGAVSMHHAIIGKPKPGFVVDHINRNPLDNTRENLRFVTYSVSARNTSSFRGNVRKQKNGYVIQMYFRTLQDAEEGVRLLKEYRDSIYEDN